MQARDRVRLCGMRGGPPSGGLDLPVLQDLGVATPAAHSRAAHSLSLRRDLPRTGHALAGGVAVEEHHLAVQLAGAAARSLQPAELHDLHARTSSASSHRAYFCRCARPGKASRTHCFRSANASSSGVCISRAALLSREARGSPLQWRTQVASTIPR